MFGRYGILKVLKTKFSHFFEYKCILITVSFISGITALNVVTERTTSCLSICRREQIITISTVNKPFAERILLSRALCVTLFILSAGQLCFNRSQIF